MSVSKKRLVKINGDSQKRDLLVFDFSISPNERLTDAFLVGTLGERFDDISFWIGMGGGYVVISSSSWASLLLRDVKRTNYNGEAFTFDILDSMYWTGCTREDKLDLLNIYPTSTKRFVLTNPSGLFDLYLEFREN